MEAIASEEGVSRSTVSRLLETARAAGIVSIQVVPVHGRASVVEQEIAHRHGVSTRVVPLPDGVGAVERLHLVARTAGRVLDSAVAAGMIVGVAWGTTTSAVSEHLLARPLADVQVVQLNGAMNTLSSGVGYGTDVLGRFAAAWDAQVHHFPVPAFFDHVETRQAMWRERSVQRVLRLQHAADVALFGIGAFGGAVPSRVWAEGYLTGPDRAALTATAVGDVCTVFLRADGSWEGLPLNARSSGPVPPVLRRIPRRICAVADEAKVPGLLAALAAGLVTDLVLDERAARELLSARAVTRRAL
ncbi:transcriptional regulator [Quadrisphaera setariae]|uniref:Transcriptional regulator n=2 Tax=Quadrisphaera setariae TaxID=2593304 RepID=A0A5C8ZM36_9ACTN|nr:transcriptional regulator [Quadrisphaera setariae]